MGCLARLRGAFNKNYACLAKHRQRTAAGDTVNAKRLQAKQRQQQIRRAQAQREEAGKTQHFSQSSEIVACAGSFAAVRQGDKRGLEDTLWVTRTPMTLPACPFDNHDTH